MAHRDLIPARSDESGYTLVMFVMVIAVMSIMMGVAVQAVSFQMQREKEEELIFRGRQYVEAVRLFKNRYGRYPMRLKEMWEADPKVIRQKWKDPITDSEDWGVIFLGQENMGARRPGQRDIGLGTPLPTQTPGSQSGLSGSAGSGRDGLPDGVSRNEDGELVGPIVGVHSTSCEESIKIYEGRTTYCEWRFFYKDEQQGSGRGGGGGNQGGQRTPSGGYHGGDTRDDFENRRRTPRPYRTPRGQHTVVPRRTGTPGPGF